MVLAIIGLIIGLACLAGYGLSVLLFWLLPGRVSKFFLSYLFDYVPHRPHDFRRSQDEYRATHIVGGPILTVLVGYVRDSHPATSDLQWMLFPTRPDLVQWAESINLPTRPLKSSKGFADEMILPVRPASISNRVREQLFVWGLDWA